VTVLPAAVAADPAVTLMLATLALLEVSVH